MANTTPRKPTIKVEPITTAEDIARFYDISANGFAVQAKDGIWIAMHPGWDTPEGRDAAITRLVNRWSNTTKDRDNNPNTIFLKATMPVPGQEDKEVITGVAIWVQASVVEGHGDASATMDPSALYPDNPSEQRYLRQLDDSLHRRRADVVREVASTSSPAVMALDLCVVDPEFQRLGIASKLVQWGLDEAKRRGGLESVLEASSMGRHAYRKLGFEQEGSEIEYHVDEEFRERVRPSNIFMRTGRPASG